MKIFYERIEIKSENDLPKITGMYNCHRIRNRSKHEFDYIYIDEHLNKFWMDNFDAYLIPFEQE